MKRSELYQFLRGLATENRILEFGTPEYETCKDLLIRLGINVFDPTDVGKILDALGEFERKVGNVEKIEKTLEQIKNKEPDVEINELGSEQLSKAQLDSLVEDYEDFLNKQKEGTEAGKVVDQYVKGLRERYGKNQVERIRERLTEIAKIADDKRISVEKAARVVEIEDELKVVSPEMQEGEVAEMAEDLVLKSEAEVKEKIKDLQISNNEKEFILQMQAEEAASREFDQKVEEAAKLIVDKHENPNDKLTEKERNETEKLLKDEITKKVLDPLDLENEERPKIKYELDEKGKLKIVAVIAAEKEVGQYVYKGGIERKPTKLAIGVKDDDGKVSLLDKEIKETVKKMREDSSSSKKLEADIREKMFGRQGLDPHHIRAQIKQAQAAVVLPGEYQQVVEALGKSNVSNESISEAITTAKLLKGNLGKIINAPAELDKLSKQFKDVKALQNANNTVQKITKEFGGTKQLKFASDIIKLRESLNPLNLLARFPGMEGLKSFGSQGVGKMAIAIASQIEVQGLRQGITFSLKAILSKGVVPLAVEGSKIAATLGTDSALLAASTLGGLPGWLIFLAIEAAKKVFDLVKKAGDFVEKNIEKALSAINLGRAERKAWLQDNFGNFGGNILYKISQIGDAIAVFTVASSIPIIIIILALGIIYYLFVGTEDLDQMIVGLLPNNVPIGEARYCVPMRSAAATGNVSGANCAVDTGPQALGTSVDRAQFANLASRWNGGATSDNAFNCFNDVVNSAIKANVNPDYALWVWLHESGASSNSSASDFGVLSAGTNNFSGQLTAILQLDPAKACPDLAATDYWLAYSTDFLTGGCNPDAAIGGVTGHTYEAEMKTTWSWMTSAPMPKTIFSGSGGSVAGSSALLQTIASGSSNYLCEMTPEKSGTAAGTGGSHIVPPSSNYSLTPQPTRDPSIPIPPGCPFGYPVKGNYPIVQGPGGGYSHIVQGGYPGEQLQAIDISNSVGGLNGVDVLATSPGVVVFSGDKGAPYGNTVIIEGSCGNQKFVTIFAHLMDGSLIPVNTQITQPGLTIGQSDNTGQAAGGVSHIHYELRGCGPTENPLYCQGFETLQISNYLPVPIAPGCDGNCGNTGGK